MKVYNRPEFYVTEFMANNAVAGCDRVVTGTATTTTYDKQSVYCVIGEQNETVFNSASGCTDTTATQWAVVAAPKTYEGYIVKDQLYFIWFTYAGDTGSGGAPSASETAPLDALVSAANLSTGSGWHYAPITSSTQVTDILGFSY